MNHLHALFDNNIIIYPQSGFHIDVNGEMSCVRGTVLVVLADTLAAHQLGGFKIGVGFSLRKCRQWMATLDDMQTQVYILFCRLTTELDRKYAPGCCIE